MTNIIEKVKEVVVRSNFTLEYPEESKLIRAFSHIDYSDPTSMRNTSFTLTRRGTSEENDELFLTQKT